MKLFVGLGNLGVPQVGYDDNITSSDLRLLFEQYGVVTECDCITNKNYAFVHMEEDSQATAAVENLDGHWVKGRPIKVEKSESKGPRKPSQKVQKLFIGNIAEGTTNEKTMASEAVRERSPDRRDRRDSRGPKRSGPSRFQRPPERIIFVSNIPFEMKLQEVKDLFRENVGDVIEIELYSDENDKHLGRGILEFGSEAEAKQAVEKMHHYDYKGRKLVVKGQRTRSRLVGKSGDVVNDMVMNSGPHVAHSRVMIPQEKHPEINFIGFLIGPRGNTLKSMESETGAKILIRGKGCKEATDEPLHAYVTSTNPEAVKKAVDKIRNIIKEAVDVPEGQNDLRRHQLRELALLNGTLREGDGPRCSNCGGSDHKSWQCQDKPNVTNNVVCTTCGGVGHISKDCMGKKTGSWDQGPKTAMDEEYMSLMAELGEGPGPAAPPSAPNSGPKEDKQAWRGNNSGGGPGRNMFQGGPPRHPRPLMGPGGPRGGPPPPPGDYENNWGPGAPPPPPPGTKPPPSGSGGNWNMPPPPPGMGAPPPSSGGGQWGGGGGGGGGGYGMPPPGYGVPPPPPGSGPGGPPPPSNGSNNQWSSWPPPPGGSGGPGPVPPPPRSYAPPPPGAPPGMPPSWPPPPGWQPPNSNSNSGSGILSNLIGAPPPPPPPS